MQIILNIGITPRILKSTDLNKLTCQIVCYVRIIFPKIRE